MKTVRVNKLNVGYALEGPEGAPVVMFGNSLLTDLNMWERQAATFSRDYRVLRYDTRGHGRSDATKGPYSIELLAADAVSLLDALDLQRVHFVGLSLGGMIGQHLGAHHGNRLNSLVLCDTAVMLPPASMWDGRITLAMDQGLAPFVPMMTERWLTEGYRKDNVEVVSAIGEMITGTKLDGFLGCAGAIRAMDNRELLPLIKTPTMVVVGEKDGGTPVSAAEVLHAGIHGSKLRVIADAAHLPNIEQQDVFDAAVMGFLSQH